MGIRCGVCGLPELPGKFGVPFRLFLAGGFLGFGNAGFQGFAFGGGHILAGLPAPCTFITCAPVLPPDRSRSIEERLVCPVMAVRLVSSPAAVQ